MNKKTRTWQKEMEKWTQKVPSNPVVLLKQHSNQKFKIHYIELTADHSKYDKWI